MTRLLLERGVEGGAQAIPPTLQQSLAARLDRLGEAREVAQIGAVLGRDSVLEELVRRLSPTASADCAYAAATDSRAAILRVARTAPSPLPLRGGDLVADSLAGDLALELGEAFGRRPRVKPRAPAKGRRPKPFSIAVVHCVVFARPQSPWQARMRGAPSGAI